MLFLELHKTFLRLSYYEPVANAVLSLLNSNKAVRIQQFKDHVTIVLRKYRVRQRGCSLTHSARTPPAVHQGITICVDEIEFEKK